MTQIETTTGQAPFVACLDIRPGVSEFEVAEFLQTCRANDYHPSFRFCDDVSEFEGNTEPMNIHIGSGISDAALLDMLHVCRRESLLPTITVEPFIREIEAAAGGDVTPGIELAPMVPQPDIPAPAPEVDYEDAPPLATVHLRYPFRIEGTEVRSIDLRPPSMIAMMDYTAGVISRVELIAAMASQSVAAIRSIRWQDAEAVILVARAIAPENSGE